jgi:hypothetical protein
LNFLFKAEFDDEGLEGGQHSTWAPGMLNQGSWLILTIYEHKGTVCEDGNARFATVTLNP